MKIEVTCHNCADDNEPLVDMKLDGPLFVNPETGTQAQVYECECGVRVTVMVRQE